MTRMICKFGALCKRRGIRGHNQSYRHDRRRRCKFGTYCTRRHIPEHDLVYEHTYGYPSPLPRLSASSSSHMMDYYTPTTISSPSSSMTTSTTGAATSSSSSSIPSATTVISTTTSSIMTIPSTSKTTSTMTSTSSSSISTPTTTTTITTMSTPMATFPRLMCTSPCRGMAWNVSREIHDATTPWLPMCLVSMVEDYLIVPQMERRGPIGWWVHREGYVKYEKGLSACNREIIMPMLEFDEMKADIQIYNNMAGVCALLTKWFSDDTNTIRKEPDLPLQFGDLITVMIPTDARGVSNRHEYHWNGLSMVMEPPCLFDFASVFWCDRSNWKNQSEEKIHDKSSNIRFTDDVFTDDVSRRNVALIPSSWTNTVSRWNSSDWKLEWDRLLEIPNTRLGLLPMIRPTYQGSTTSIMECKYALVRLPIIESQIYHHLMIMMPPTVAVFQYDLDFGLESHDYWKTVSMFLASHNLTFHACIVLSECM